MESSDGRKLTKLAAVIVAIIIIAALAGWLIGRHNSNKASNTVTASSTSADSGSVKSLISYSLPSGWAQADCSSNIVYVAPNGVPAPDCTSSPQTPITISIDAQNTTDCSQLSNVQNVQKHTCKSLYIDGHKSLYAVTQTKSNNTDLTVSDYYINTGKGVVKLEYRDTPPNAYQTGFDELAKNVVVK